MCANEVVLSNKQKNEVDGLTIKRLIIYWAGCLAKSCQDFSNCTCFSVWYCETFTNTSGHDFLSFKYSTSNFFQVCNPGIFSKKVNELIDYIFLFSPGQFSYYKFWFKEF